MFVSRPSTGLIATVIASASFGTSGVLAKPLLETGWSPTAAVAARTLTGGLLLLPLALAALRGRWSAVWRGRWRILGLGAIGVAGAQLGYFAALRTVPVSTALLIEFLAPVLLVAVTAVTARRLPARIVLLGSALAVGGLILVIGPGALQPVDPAGLACAFVATIGCAVYFVIAARPGDDLPPVALASGSLLVGAALLGALGISGLVPFTAAFTDGPMFGATVAWWVPLLGIALISTAVAYVAGIAGSALLGSRLASFVGLLEVVFASLLAWLALDETLTPLQLGGGLLILGGIAAVRAERPVGPDGPDPDGGLPPTPTEKEAPTPVPVIRSGR